MLVNLVAQNRLLALTLVQRLQQRKRLVAFPADWTASPEAKFVPALVNA